MAKKNNKSIWLVAPIIAIVFIIIAIVVILANGYRYTTYDDGSKFIGSVDNGQPISGKIKFFQLRVQLKFQYQVLESTHLGLHKNL